MCSVLLPHLCALIQRLPDLTERSNCHISCFIGVVYALRDEPHCVHRRTNGRFRTMRTNMVICFFNTHFLQEKNIFEGTGDAPKFDYFSAFTARDAP